MGFSPKITKDKPGICFNIFDSNELVLVSTGASGFVVPQMFNNYYLSYVIARVSVRGIGGLTEVQIRKNRDGLDYNMLASTVKLGFVYYAANGVVNSLYRTLLTGDMIYVDIAAVNTTAPYGLSVTLEFGEV